MDSTPLDKLLPTESAAALRNGAFISDLHLFCPRSVSVETHHQLSQYQDASECIVLGGDIFDFRWSTHESHDASLAAARDWLLELLSVTGQTNIVFLPGNHDCVPEFLAELELLATNEPRFTWHNHHVQIHDCLFLHGDILDAGPSLHHLATYRRKFHHSVPKSRLSQRSYDAAVAMRIHMIIPSLRRLPRRTCKELLKAIQKMELADAAAVRRVYFGHTHVRLNGIEVDGIKFFNPGGSLRHLKTHEHEFSFDRQSDPKNGRPGDE
jgi:UDP-2,3-diacylglucosamine hydrolase